MDIKVSIRAVSLQHEDSGNGFSIQKQIAMKQQVGKIYIQVDDGTLLCPVSSMTVIMYTFWPVIGNLL